MSRWTADSLPYAAMLVGCAMWFAWEFCAAIINARAAVREFRDRRYRRALVAAFADGDIDYRIGATAGQPVT